MGTTIDAEVNEAKLTTLGAALGCVEPAPKKRKRREPEEITDGTEITKQDTELRPALVPLSADVLPIPVMDLATAKRRLAEFQEFVKGYLVKGEDYGLIPGVAKPSLFQPGADKLNELYGFAPTFPDERVIRTVDWAMNPPLFDYEVTCVLINKRTGNLAAEAKGSCSSYEGRYRWRDSKRKCPQCGQETIIAGKEEYGGGWLCWKKRGGCGAKFATGDKSIEDQIVGRVPNEDIVDIKNTVLKMAQKRAKIAATIAASRSAGVFTQDVEDMAGIGGDSQQAAVSDGLTITGFLERKTPLNGALWMICKGQEREWICTAKGDLKQRLDNIGDETVTLLVKPKQNRDERHFFEVIQLMNVQAAEDVPF